MNLAFITELWTDWTSFYRTPNRPSKPKFGGGSKFDHSARSSCSKFGIFWFVPTLTKPISCSTKGLPYISGVRTNPPLGVWHCPVGKTLFEPPIFCNLCIVLYRYVLHQSLTMWALSEFFQYLHNMITIISYPPVISVISYTYILVHLGIFSIIMASHDNESSSIYSDIYAASDFWA